MLEKYARTDAAHKASVGHFWGNILRAAETTPHQLEIVRGASGINHPVIGIGIDAQRKRLIVLTKEVNARAASLVQADIQLANPEMKVIVVRPVPVSIPSAYNAALRSGEDFKCVGDNVQEMWKHAVSVSPLDLVSAWEDAEHPRVAVTMVTALLESDSFDIQTDSKPQKIRTPSKSMKFLERIALQNPTQGDRDLGICPMPLYEFPVKDLSRLRDTEDVEHAKKVLIEQNSLQFFFPAPDMVALGLVDRMNPATTQMLIRSVRSVAGLGHPLGPAEIVRDHGSIGKIIDELQTRKLIVEGEVGLELSIEGHTVRQKVKFKPRESIISKLINRVSIRINLTELLSIGKKKN